jgi:hypothetical protein
VRSEWLICAFQTFPLNALMACNAAIRSVEILYPNLLYAGGNLRRAFFAEFLRYQIIEVRLVVSPIACVLIRKNPNRQNQYKYSDYVKF